MNGTSGGGIGVLGLLGVVFIVLKLVGVIAWSWWWVLAPFWVPAVLGVVIFGLVILVGIIIAALGKE